MNMIPPDNARPIYQDTELESYKQTLASIATFGDDRSSRVAASVLGKYDDKAHFCNDWDGLFVYLGMPELKCCHCFEPRDLSSVNQYELS